MFTKETTLERQLGNCCTKVFNTLSPQNAPKMSIELQTHKCNIFPFTNRNKNNE